MLRDALKDPARALSSFSFAIRSSGLGRRWHMFRYDALRGKLIDWASSNSITVSPGWFVAGAGGTSQNATLVDLFKQLAAHMTEDELNGMQIPMRAVYQFWLGHRDHET